MGRGLILGGFTVLSALDALTTQLAIAASLPESNGLWAPLIQLAPQHGPWLVKAATMPLVVMFLRLNANKRLAWCGLEICVVLMSLIVAINLWQLI